MSATGYDECLEKMFEVLKRTAFKENVAIEISYCSNLLSLIEKGNKNALFCFNCIIDGLGEILSLSEVLNLDFLNILKYLYNNSYDMPEYAVVLLNCVAKFNLIFSNESYTFDENKETKIELEKIKFFLNNLDENFIEVLKEISLETLQEDNIFIFCALNIVREFNIDFAFNNLEVLLKTSNDILKYEIIDIIKEIGFLDKINAEKILSSISDKNLRVIIENVFNK